MSAVFAALLDELYRDYLESALAAFAEAAGSGQHAKPCSHNRREILGQVIGVWNALLDQAEYLRLRVRGTHAAQGWGHACALAIDLLANDAIRMKDALHAASAILLAAPLLTVDRDYARLPVRLLSIVTDPEQVDPMRRLRGRRT